MGRIGWTLTLDVDAKAERPSSVDQLHEMFQTLLAERFKLRFHRERKELAAYVLSVDKSGSKLKVSDSKEPFDIPIKPGDRPGKKCRHQGSDGVLVLLLGPASQCSSGHIRPVSTDSMTSHWSCLLPRHCCTPGPAPAPALRPGRGPHYRAPQAAWAKLESHKAPVEVFVIDHVERPTNN